MPDIIIGKIIELAFVVLVYGEFDASHKLYSVQTHLHWL
jgi:hypothetical protein